MESQRTYIMSHGSLTDREIDRIEHIKQIVVTVALACFVLAAGIGAALVIA